MTLKQRKTTSNIITANSTFQKLSIQVSLSGLSFCILDTVEETIVAFEEHSFHKTLAPETAQAQVKSILEAANIIQNAYKSVTVIHENELSAFVPASLFNEHELSSYLKFNVKIFENDHITFDVLKNSELVNVYVPYVNLNNYFFDVFGEFEFKHVSTVLVDSLISKPSTEAVMHAFIANNHFELVVLKNKKLQLYNTFTYLTPQDFIYYLLFTAEQLALNPETFKLYLYGNVSKEDELYNIAYTYIRELEIAKNPYQQAFAEDIDSSNSYSKYLLNHSF
jgi:hypothetical protein